MTGIGGSESRSKHTAANYHPATASRAPAEPRYPDPRAPVAQWREQRFPKPRAQVRFLPGANPLFKRRRASARPAPEQGMNVTFRARSCASSTSAAPEISSSCPTDSGAATGSASPRGRPRNRSSSYVFSGLASARRRPAGKAAVRGVPAGRPREPCATPARISATQASPCSRSRLDRDVVAAEAVNHVEQAARAADATDELAFPDLLARVEAAGRFEARRPWSGLVS